MLVQKAVLVEVAPPSAIVTLNRPERRNALSLELMRELTGTFEQLSHHPDVRTMILRASGPVFSAGHDLAELVGGDEARYQEIFDACVVLMETIQAVPQPVIAEVAGVATAAGCQLVATCDLAVAAEGARFATPGVRIGLFCSTPMVALSRAIGRKRALEMLLTGEAIDARTAAEWGLVNRVVPAEELESATRALAEKIAEASPLTVKIGKQAFYRQIDLDQPAAYGYTRDVMVQNTLARDAQEGMSAFLEKRRPEWTGS
jgi:enoyl-CoA hydratase/carnithine racemase